VQLEVVAVAEAQKERVRDEGYGPFLRRRRLDRRLTQRQFAAKVGVDFSYMSKVETGRLPPPSEATIIQIAKVLGDSTEDHLAQARKVPLDLRAAVAAFPVEAAMLLREMRAKPVRQDTYLEMLRTLRKAKTSRRSTSTR
jgi:HTH-type transcriptional regulator, competence development regulator